MDAMGIYQIKNLINNKIYIGSSTNIDKRWNNHIYKWLKNTHPNLHFQNAFNKYGIENFIFEILEIVEDVNLLIEREQFYIDDLKPQYNIRLIAESNIGFKHSEETKKNMSEARKGKGF